MSDMTNINQRLSLLDEMYAEKQRERTDQIGTANLSKKIKDIDRRIGRFTKKLETNGKETGELVTQTRLMMHLKRNIRDSDKPSERLSLSPDLMPLSNNFSSIDSLNRYISHQNSTNEVQQSGKLTFSEDS